MVLAMLLEERDGASIDLVESNRKKAAFLRTALAGNRIARVHARRIEDMGRLLPVPEIVTARALAPLPALLGLAAPWLTSGTEK